MSVLPDLRWYLHRTGGGCTALRLDLPNGEHALFTRDAMAPTAAELDGAADLLIGLYDRNDEQIGTCESTAAVCLAWLDQLAAQRLTAWERRHAELDRDVAALLSTLRGEG